MYLGSFKEAIKFWSGHEIYLEELGLEDFLVSGGICYLLKCYLLFAIVSGPICYLLK